MRKTWLALAVVLVLMMAFAGSAMADTETVSYYDPAQGSTPVSQPGVNVVAAGAYSEEGWGTPGNTSWYVVKGTTTLTGSDSTPPLTILGDVRLIIKSGATLTADASDCSDDQPGIYVPQGSTLTIYGTEIAGTGKIEATAAAADNASGGAGIGAPFWENAGTIIIKGGNITATGSGNAAGIGGGGSDSSSNSNAGNCAAVEIHHGKVTANGAGGGAGIGGGGAVDTGTAGKLGKFTISGTAQVNAVGGNGINGKLPAAIGSGATTAAAGVEILQVKSSPTSAVLGGSATLSLDNTNVTIGAGVSYQWQRIGVTGTWANVGNTAGLTINPVDDTAYQYQCIINKVATSSLGVPSAMFTLPLKYATPSITIDYENEVLKGFVANMAYRITCGGVNTDYTIDASGEIKIDDSWFGSDLLIRRKTSTNPNIDHSDDFELTVPARPVLNRKTDLIVQDESELGAADGTVKPNSNVPSNYTLVRWNAVAKEWVKGDVGNEFRNLASNDDRGQDEYLFKIQGSNTAKVFASNEVEVTIKKGPVLTAAPVIDIDYNNETLTGFTKNQYYKIKVNGGTEKVYFLDNAFVLDLADKGWFGKTLEITQVTDSTGKTLISKPCTIKVPDRPTFSLSNLLITNDEVNGTKGGTVKGVLASQQKLERKSTTGGWVASDNNVFSGLKDGMESFRIKSNNTGADRWFASLPIDVEIKAGRNMYLSMTMPTFDVAVIGYARPAAKTITIHNSSSEGMGKISLQLVDEAGAFTLRTTAIDELVTVAPGAKNTQWTIQPNANLKKGTYTATINLLVGGSKVASDTVKFVVNNPDDPTPAVTDPTAPFTVNSDGTTTVSLTVNGVKGTGLPVTVSIKDASGTVITSATGTVGSDGKVNVKFTDEQMALLTTGVSYSVWMSSPGDANNNAMASTQIGTVTRPGANTNWSVPSTFKATTGFSYQLVTYTDVNNKPALSVKVSKNSVAVNATTLAITGTLQNTSSDNTVVVTFTDASGNKQACTVTIVANRLDREYPLRLSGKYGVYSSTRSLYYNGTTLNAEIFLLNKRQNKKAVGTAGGLTLVIYQNRTPVFSKQLSKWVMTSPLKYNQRAIYYISLTPAELAAGGIPNGTLDLANGEYQAVLTRNSNVTAVLGNEGNVVVQKEVAMKDMIIKAREMPGMNNMP